MFSTGLIPPNVNLKTLNPAIRWSKYRLRVPLETLPLSTRNGSGRPLVLMCSSGIGGANGHIVLEAPPMIPIRNRASLERSPQPILLFSGGLSPCSCKRISSSILDFLSVHSNVDTRSVSVLYGRRCRGMTWRSYLIYSPDSSSPPAFKQPTMIPCVKPPIVFVFSGQGPQHFESE